LGSKEATASRRPNLTPGARQLEVPSEQGGVAILHRDIEAIVRQLRGYARCLTRDVGNADDLVQECVARALAKVHLWEAGTDLRAWLFTLLHNLHTSQRRRVARERKMVHWIEMMSASSCAPNQIDDLELRELEHALMSLPEQQRITVLLIGLTSGNYDAAASVCGVPVGTIRSRLSRGRQNLRQLMGIVPQHPRISKGCAARAKPFVAMQPSIYVARRGAYVGATQ
jgi:RNA polymerase sigma-70 factor, ECF subfamily